MSHAFFSYHGRITAWRRAIASKLFVAKALEALGALWLVSEVTEHFAPGFYKAFIGALGEGRALPLMLTLSVAWALFCVRPILGKKICIPNIDTYVSVVVGDLAQADHAVVVSANQFFNTSTELISHESVQGMITKHRFASVADLDNLLAVALATWPNERDDDPARSGKRNRYPIGTTAKVKMKDGKNAYFLAMSFMHPGGGSYSDISMIQSALAGLWERLGTHGEFEKVLGIGIIGSGAGRVPLTRFQLFREIVDSFMAASTQKKICDELRVYLYPADVREKRIDIAEFFDYLASEERFYKPSLGIVPAQNAIPE